MTLSRLIFFNYFIVMVRFIDTTLSSYEWVSKVPNSLYMSPYYQDCLEQGNRAEIPCKPKVKDKVMFSIIILFTDLVQILLESHRTVFVPMCSKIWLVFVASNQQVTFLTGFISKNIQPSHFDPFSIWSSQTNS